MTRIKQMRALMRDMGIYDEVFPEAPRCHLCGQPLDTLGCVKGADGFGHVTKSALPLEQ